MGFVKSLLSGPSKIQNVVGADPAQLNTAYNQTQSSIAQQNAFIQALQAQNGIGNQQSVFDQQQQLSGQLQGVINGTGPNPAQAQLAQSTGQNVSNQAALMAGQRGASANTGLIARQAAMQGANTQQQAAGQSATLQAQQSLGAMSQLQQQQANMGNIAGQQVGQQQNALQNVGQQSLQQQSNLLGLQQNANSANAGLQGQQMAGQYNLAGNLTGAVGKGLVAMAANGGVISSLPINNKSFFHQHLNNKMAIGGTVSGDANNPVTATIQPYNVNDEEEYKKGSSKDANTVNSNTNSASTFGDYMMGAHGGKVPALVSPGERYLPPKEVEKVAKGEKAPMRAGEKIPGKPKVGGARNSYANDTVSKQLDEGGIIIPRSVTQGKNPEKAAHDFVSAILAKSGKRLPKKGK